MKYSVFTLFAVAAAFVAAAPTERTSSELHDIIKGEIRMVDANYHTEVKRQSAGVPVNEAAMTDANGNIVPFNTAGVYQANKEAGI
ncbi:hypothetical protein CMUS01_13451 [Colletotrichum musicola]|uniref:Uncharacterized protein n=1 Tax=Colletotrichum musicola TaxID=2175873 RepID=A0A8H6MVH7_9PEZI|nr:hypothetical protein CMUS01_13451 [Colletotrichum musicola]